jgi:transcriptional regulator with XRE-family HTH domain
MIYDARQKARLSQAELAERIGTKQGVISRLEDADYKGHSLGMLLRVASALGKQISIEFHNPPKARSKAAPSRKPAPANVDN